MGKRSDFERAPRDFYPTPIDAVLPLRSFICAGTKFAEPCAGDGALIRHLESVLAAKCMYAGDIAPAHGMVTTRDAMELENSHIADCSVIITNPPWRRDILHALIRRFIALRPTWLLFDADWPHTKQSAPLMEHCRAIVPVGRLKWIPGSKHVGKDNCCWYRFDRKPGPTTIYPRIT